MRLRERAAAEDPHQVRAPNAASRWILEQFAQLHSIEIPESQDRPVVPHANKRHGTSGRRRRAQKVGYEELVAVFEALEIVRLSRAGLSLTFGKVSASVGTLDVSLTVSAFDRKEPEKAKPASSADVAEDSK